MNIYWSLKRLQIYLEKDWNAEFQTCLEMVDSLDKFKALSNLARDFSYAARIYGSIIISEYPFFLFSPLLKDFLLLKKYYTLVLKDFFYNIRYYLSNERKTIKPVVVGGIAGGHKYIALGILFKVYFSLRFSMFQF